MGSEACLIYPGDNYKALEQTWEGCGNAFHIPSHLDKRKLRGLETRVNKEKEKLKKDVDELSKLTFTCEPDARDALARFIKKKGSAFYPLDGTVEHSRERVKRNPYRAMNESIICQDVYCKTLVNALV
ncbi:MAG: hypothetical protein AB1767_13305 [Bacillota bacterium]